MRGPLSCDNFNKVAQVRVKIQEEELIPDRSRCTVMGMIIHHRDQNTCIVTVAIVDKYGELIKVKNFHDLMPPSKFVAKAQGGE